MVDGFLFTLVEVAIILRSQLGSVENFSTRFTAVAVNSETRNSKLESLNSKVEESCFLELLLSTVNY